MFVGEQRINEPWYFGLCTPPQLAENVPVVLTFRFLFPHNNFSIHLRNIIQEKEGLSADKHNKFHLKEIKFKTEKQRMPTSLERGKEFPGMQNRC